MQIQVDAPSVSYIPVKAEDVPVFEAFGNVLGASVAKRPLL